MSQTLVRPPPALFMPQKQAAKPMTRRLKVVSESEPAGTGRRDRRTRPWRSSPPNATRSCSASPGQGKPSPWRS